jgi:cell fate (sporulation/competence/biofilm development) regulator YmcA (YheA/YmcA/DUF963 family)
MLAYKCMEILNHILIFKTNIATAADRLLVGAVLDAHPLIVQWTVDMTDVDCVLRVVSRHLSTGEVITLVTGCNYACTELMD